MLRPDVKQAMGFCLVKKSTGLDLTTSKRVKFTNCTLNSVSISLKEYTRGTIIKESTNHQEKATSRNRKRRIESYVC